MLRRYLLLALAIALSACRPARTEILVVVDSDLQVPTELDQVVIEVVGPQGEPRRAYGDLASRANLPASLGLESRDGGGTLLVTVTGLRRGSNVVQRRARFAFIRGETRIARLDLLRGCVGVSCAVDQTCGDNGCRELELASTELVPYTPDLLTSTDGGAPRSDGGSVECVAAVEQCNDADDDCDGRTDEDFDLRSDMRHCGSCDVACPTAPDNGASLCDDGTCRLQCDRGFADCDGNIENGCETPTSTQDDCGGCGTACDSSSPFCEEGDSGPICVASCGLGSTDCGGACVDLTIDSNHCGACGNRCVAPANAIPSCTRTGCDFVCDAGFADCDGLATNGCESNLRDQQNCGTCGQRCDLPGAASSCATRSCALASCNPMRGDCDGDPVNGCERDLRSDPARCGACDIACPASPANATSTCAQGQCTLTCAPGYGNCDNNAANGCEQALSTTAHCGGCGIQCSTGSPLCSASGDSYRCTSGCGGGEVSCGTSCVSTSTDPSHCSGCNMPCSGAPNAQPTCAGGVCARRCLTGYGDCDGNPANGCEQSLTSTSHCGDCDEPCPSPPHTVPSCQFGTCGWDCATGWADCNGQASDGCEVDTRTSSQHCGQCDRACTTGSNVAGVACQNSSCRITACTGSYVDCDGAPANGCEIDTSTSHGNCGGCGRACAHNRNCCDSTCQNRGQCRS